MSALWASLLITIHLFYGLKAYGVPDVTMTDWSVTSTSIRVRYSCNYRCRSFWTVTAWCCAEQYYPPSCQRLNEKSVTFVNLHPSSMYTIYTEIHAYPQSYFLKSKDIWTGESAQCAHPAIRNMKNHLDGYKEYYYKNEVISVQCNSGYYPSSPTMRCDNPRTSREWTPPFVTCTARCKKPTIGNLGRLYEDKKTYNKEEEVKVQCISGYYPSSDKMTCNNPGTSREWIPHTVTCIGITTTVSGVTTTSISVRISCNPECPDTWRFSLQCCAEPYYSGSCKTSYGKSATFTDLQPISQYRIYTYRGQSALKSADIRTKESATAQCKKPTIGSLGRLSEDMEYYKKGEEVQVQCISGYYPTSDKMTCNNPGTFQEWTTPTVTCIGITMTDWKVTSTSISVRISCNPECPDTWEFTVRCCAEPDSGSCKTSSGKSATFTDLQPISLYRINTTWGQSSLKSADIRTGESAPGQPEIMKVPSIEDDTIRWRLSDGWGTITGFQMNISAWRDYNVSFAVNKSLRLPSNVTEYEIPLQYGTNYTITLRGFTSVGAGEVTTRNIETHIGDPPRHTEKTLTNVTLQLHPVPDLNGPIRSYEIIVSGGQEGNSTMDCLRVKNTPYNPSSALSPYTAAVFPAETLTRPRTFNLGDDQHYNGFHNAPRIPKHNYTVYIRVTSRWKHVEKSSCAFAGVIGGVTIEKKDDPFIVVLSLTSLGIIIGMLALKLLALVGLMMVQFSLWMKGKHPIVCL